MTEEPLIAAYVPPVLRSTAIAPTDCKITARYNEAANVTHFKYELNWVEVNDDCEGDATRLVTAPSASVQSRSMDRSGISKSNLSSLVEGLALSDLEPPAKAVERGGLPSSNGIGGVICDQQALQAAAAKADSERANRTFDFGSASNSRANSLRSVSSVHARLKDGVRCDGPCGRQHKSEALTLLGRCGHYLCKACASIILNADGSAGCSSKSCYRYLFDCMPQEMIDKLYEEYVLKKQSTRQRDIRCCKTRSDDKSCNKSRGKCSVPVPSGGAEGQSIPSLSNDRLEQTGTSSRLAKRLGSSEAVLFRLLTIDHGPSGTLKKSHMEMELCANLTLREALTFVLGENPSRRTTDVFRLRRRADGNHKLEDYQLNERGDTRLFQIPTRKPKFHFAIDYTGNLRKQFARTA